MIAALSRWLDQQSAEALLIYFPLFFVAVTWLGIFLVRPFLRFWLRRQPGANDLIGFASAGFTLFYGVLLGLLTVATYQNVKDVADNVNREALSIGTTIIASATGFGNRWRSELQTSLRDYTLYVINKDWPAHRQGLIPMGGEHRLQVIREQLLSLEPAGKTQRSLCGLVNRGTIGARGLCVHRRRHRAPFTICSASGRGELDFALVRIRRTILCLHRQQRLAWKCFSRPAIGPVSAPGIGDSPCTCKILQ